MVDPIPKIGNSKVMNSGLKTSEWDILNPEYPIYTLLILFLILSFGYFYGIKVTFDNNYRYNAMSIGLISDWIKVSCSQDGF